MIHDLCKFLKEKFENHCSYNMGCDQQIVVSTVIFAICVSCVAAFSQSEENLAALMKVLNLPQKPERHLVNFVNDKYKQPDTPTVTEFNWKSCGTSADPVSADVVLAPDPLPIPGNITVSVNATLKAAVASPVKLALNIQKKILIWITIPCVNNVGSCTYDDACQLLEQAFPPPCPPPFSTYKLPCNCPFAAGSYSLPPSVMEVQNVNIPEWLTSGDYKVNARMTDSGGQELACYDIDLTLN